MAQKTQSLSTSPGSLFPSIVGEPFRTVEQALQGVAAMTIQIKGPDGDISGETLARRGAWWLARRRPDRGVLLPLH